MNDPRPPSEPADPAPRGRLAASLGVSALAGLVAAVLATLIAVWLPSGPWNGALAAAAVAAVAALPVAWHALRLRRALREARERPAIDPGMRDPVSGMYRRGPFLALAEREWSRAARYGGEVALMLVEVDRLRAMTDVSGPAVADALLSGLGRDVLKTLRGADLIARFDAAQLAVFLPQADPTGALDVADRLRERVEQLKLPGLPGSTRLTASIGVSVLRPQQHALATLVADAGQVLQLARHAGGNCVRMTPADASRRARPGPSRGPAPHRRSDSP